MKAIAFELIEGLCVGLEHFSGDEDDFFHWSIVIHCLVFRIVIAKHKEE